MQACAAGGQLLHLQYTQQGHLKSAQNSKSRTRGIKKRARAYACVSRRCEVPSCFVSARMGHRRIHLRAVALALSFSLSHAVDVTLHYDMARAVSFVCLVAAAFSTGVSRGWPRIGFTR